MILIYGPRTARLIRVAGAVLSGAGGQAQIILHVLSLATGPASLLPRPHARRYAADCCPSTEHGLLHAVTHPAGHSGADLSTTSSEKSGIPLTFS